MARSRDPAIREFTDILEECEAKGVDEDIRNKIKNAIALAEAREAYCAGVSTQPSEVLKTIQKGTMEYPFEQAFIDGKTKWKCMPGMMSGAFEGVFLQTIVSMTNAKRVLEIGMFTGYAAMACAEAIPEDGTVVTCEFDPFLEGIAKDFFAKSPHGKKITIKIGPAQETLLQLVEEKAEFDLVFIDANKEGYTEYFKTVLDKGLLSKRGTIVLDNALMGGHAYMKETTNKNGIAIRECNEYIQSRDDVVKVLVPVRDGVMVVRRKEDVYY
ncbi:hypothetical protein ACF0H5_022106 [Mactra antiquata]